MSEAEIKRTWVVAVTVLNINSGDTETKYYANGAGFTSKTTDTPANTHFAPRVLQALDLTRSLFGIRTTRGRSVFTPGDVILNNADGDLDAFMENWVVDGQTITAYYGPQGDFAFPDDFEVAFTGTMLDAEVSRSEVRLKIRDRQAELSIPLQTDKFAGTNSNGQGVEGGSDIAGQPVPIVYGAPRNVTPKLVNPQKLIYQVADKQMNSIAVYDRGIPLEAPLDSWEAIDPATGFAAAAAGIFALAYGDGVMVAAGGDAGSGANGRIETAAIGGAWTNRTSGFGTEDVFALAHGNPFGNTKGIFVAAGSAAVMTTSRDGGVTWVAETSGFTADDVNGAVYWEAKKLFVIVGNGGKIATSPGNGTWTLQTSGVATALEAVFASPTHCVAVGASGVILYSTDGTTWGTATSNTAAMLRCVTWGQTCGWVAAGDSVIVSGNTSADHWTSRNTDARTHRGATYGNGVALIVSDTNVEYTSRDGKVWTRISNVVGGAIPAITNRAALVVEDVFYRAGDTATNGAIYRTEVIAAYSTLGDIENDAEAPPQGAYRTLLTSTGSYFRLGAAPDGNVTCDPVEKASDADMTAAQVAKRILEDRGGMTSGDYSAGDITALDSANDAVVGFYSDSEMEIGAALDQVLGSVGAAWFSDVASDFRFKRFQKPSGSPVATFKANNLIRPLQRVQSQDPQGGLPSYSSIVQWGKNYTPMAADIAAGVEPDRRNELIAASYKAEATNSTVKDRHPLSPQIVDDSLLTTEDDAQAEANRRLALREEKSDVFEVVVALTDTNIAIELNDVIELIHDRYGLNVEGDDEFGGMFRVIEVRASGRDNELALVVWGRRPINRVSSTGAYRVSSAGAYRVAA